MKRRWPNLSKRMNCRRWVWEKRWG